ncbi:MULTISPECIES: GNAT family N-acetyltransferase [unclassified Streptomyces]|uniref:GNAT family N-acetyltransferase n=1 Tax=unclassified Streptomyces TaxID=2593676 RepID=UPI0020C0E244|nr:MULTISPECIES: GNAT family N-acetyltransferase [unclassified Streptomyces]MCL6289951.1 GNAT family N-acetyltransferase [Streptomyces sp. 43Y-GA-1]MDX3342185.1 GNAT family N-acetyltransferase [Streptomyces sp. ME02-6979.5a]
MIRTLSTPPAMACGCLSRAPQPVLPVGDGLLLRAWERADAAAFLSVYQDEETRRWHTHRPSTVAQVEEWFDGYRLDWEREKGCHFAVVREDGDVLGRVALRRLNFDDGVANAAYWVLPAARGAGVATRALAALSAWALDDIGFWRLELDHSTRNAASCRVATKAGYRLEGTKRNAAVHDDGRHDMHLHARIRGDR